MDKLKIYARRLLPKSKKNLKQKEFIFPFVLVTLCFIILFLNHIPGTILSGWDTLHPEFNFSLNFTRLFFGVWREEQGLGAVAAHAHMADIPRVILLLLSSIFISLDNLRFLYIGICLILGVLGTHFFIKKAVLKNNKYAEVLAFLGGLFYLFNLGTVQQFYVPFEMFTTQYGLLPWLFLLAVKYLEAPSKSKLGLFGVVSFFAAPMAYAPLLWYAYFGGLIMFLLPFLKSHKKQVFNLIAITILVNLFWIIPNLYFLISGNAALVPDAKINKIFSEEAYLQNASFSDPLDVVIFKNFLFNWPVYAGFDRFNYLLLSWRNHLLNPYVLGILYFNFLLAILGVFAGIWKRQKVSFGLLLATLFCLVFLLSDTVPFSYLSNFVRDHFSIIKEAFRFPFTKFAIIVMFGFSVFFAYGIDLVFQLILKLRIINAKKVIIGVSIFIVINFLVVGYPSFKGELISKLMQVKIPAEYFQLFEYLNSRPNSSGRVAVLPTHSMWGWVYYDWGFQGAQFITFGIKQPVLDRDWDRWNPNNEQFYREFSYAIYSQNKEILQSVLKKYNVSYLVVDKHIIDPGGDDFNKKILYYDETNLLLDSLGEQVIEKKEFRDLKVYVLKQDNIGDLKTPNLTEQNVGKNIEFDESYIGDGDYVNLKNEVSGLEISNLNIILNKVKFADNKLDLGEISKGKSLAQVANDESYLPFKIYTKVDGEKLTLSLVLAYLDERAENGYKINFGKSDTSKLLLNIGKYQTLELKENYGNDFVYQGIGWLNSKQFNNIAIYQDSVTASQSLPFSVFKTNNIDRSTPGVIKAEYPVDLCEKAGEDQIFGAEFSDNGDIKVAAKNSAACVWVPLDKLVDSASFNLGFKDLLTLSFKTEAHANIFGRFCLYDITRRRCVKEQKYLLNSNSFKEYFLTENQELDKLSLIFYLDGKSNGKLEEINYSDIKLSVTSPNEIVSLSPEVLNTYFVHAANNIQTQELSYNSDLLMGVNLFEAGHDKNQCTNLPGNLAFRNSSSEQGFVEYHSRLGSYCDYYSFPNLSHTTGYLLKIKSENLSGLPLRLCLANPYNKRCDVYTVLPNTKAEYLVMVPPLKDGGVGYDIHFDNYAVGNYETINRIYSLELLPIPYYYLNKPNSSFESNSIENNLKITSKQMIFPGFYKASVENLGDSRSRIVVLDQSFDWGWWVYDSRHLLVNNWQNGFEIFDNRSEVVIVYWPEILGILGELISFSVVIYFVIWILKKSRLFDKIG